MPVDDTRVDGHEETTMTDATNPGGDTPYTPPPAGEPVLPPATAQPSPPPTPYQPPAAQYQPPAPPQPDQQSPAVHYPPVPPAQGAAPQKAQTSPQTMSIISLVAGAVSIFLLPYIAGVVGIGLGVTTLRLNAAARRQGATVSSGVTAMAIAGIALGALGIILKLVLDRLF